MEGPTIVVPYGYAQRGIGRTETVGEACSKPLGHVAVTGKHGGERSRAEGSGQARHGASTRLFGVALQKLLAGCHQNFQFLTS